MEGVSTFPLRLWFHVLSRPDFLSTPFYRATHGTKGHRVLKEHCPELGFDPATKATRAQLPYELVTQIMASSEEHFLRAFDPLSKHFGAVDLNCGCPAPNSVGKGAGSGLLRCPDKFAAMVEQLSCQAGPGRLGIKMRTGYESHAEFHGLLSAIVDQPLARITIHGRTRSLGYRGRARWDLIDQASRRSRCQVLGSGDVMNLETWQHLQASAPLVRTVIIGRGALRNPWLFTELRRKSREPVALAVIRTALTCYGLLHELDLNHHRTLQSLVDDGIFDVFCGTSERLWQDLHMRLEQALRHDDGAISRPTLGRIKLLWNYLRSSLPDPFADPSLLRAKSLQTFLDGFESIKRNLASAADGGVIPTYRAKFDWIFSGGGKSQQISQ